MLKRLLAPGLLCLTIGLAPYAPEPHVIGKIRWIAGGAKGMGVMDWLDLLMHGAPWGWLLFELLKGARRAKPQA